MSQVSISRAFAGLAVAVTAFAAGAAPAMAAPGADAGITMRLSNIIVPVGAAGAQVRPLWRANTEVTLSKPTITYELGAGLEGVTLSDGGGIGDCTNKSPTKLVCSYDGDMDLVPDSPAGFFTALLRAGSTARPDATGPITATFSAAGFGPIEDQATVRVAGTVDLAAGRNVSFTKSLGAAFDVPLVVRNAGRTVADGASVIFYHDFAFESTTSYRNCLYRDGQVTACTFDQSLPVGATFRGVMPYRVRKDTYAPSRSLNQLEWVTPAELQDWQDYLEKNGYRGLGTPGSGAVLKLNSQAAAQSVQADTNPDNNFTNVDLNVTGKSGTDLAAIGAKVNGAVGDRVSVTVGVHNNGPATLDWARSDEPPALVNVSIPPGTTAVTVPAGCRKISGAGKQKYSCAGTPLVVAGTSETYAFVLRIDEVVPDASGPVVVNEACECSQFEKDLDLTNNRAAILVNGTGAGSGDGDSDGGGAGDGGSGGGLPVTGPVAAAAGGVGVLLVAAGGAGLLLARRRRTRFVS